jgi:penicillin-binding protein 2
VVGGKSGTGRAIALPDIAISGKTGTAQVVGRRDENAAEDAAADVANKDHAWFVAYAPSDQPEIAVSVFVEHGEHGSDAAPLAKEIIQAYLGEAGEGEVVALVDSEEGHERPMR